MRCDMSTVVQESTFVCQLSKIGLCVHNQVGINVLYIPSRRYGCRRRRRHRRFVVSTAEALCCPTVRETSTYILQAQVQGLACIRPACRTRNREGKRNGRDDRPRSADFHFFVCLIGTSAMFYLCMERREEESYHCRTARIAMHIQWALPRSVRRPSTPTQRERISYWAGTLRR